MAYRILLRRDTAANWSANNPVLASGEPGYETDTYRMKIGDGTTQWLSLPYYVGGIGPTGPSGAQGPAGPVGPTGEGGGITGPVAGTGPNTFYGDQTVIGSVGVTGGVFLNPQEFNGNVTIPEGSNGFLVGPITDLGTITVNGVFAVL